MGEGSDHTIDLTGKHVNASQPEISHENGTPQIMEATKWEGLNQIPNSIGIMRGTDWGEYLRGAGFMCCISELRPQRWLFRRDKRNLKRNFRLI